MKWERNINDGKRVPESRESKKYELRVVLLLETLWQSFVSKDLVFEVEKEINSVISKLSLEALSDLIKNKISIYSQIYISGSKFNLINWDL